MRFNSRLRTAASIAMAALIAHTGVLRAQEPQEEEGDALRRREYLELQRRYPYAEVPAHATRHQMVSKFRNGLTLSITQSAAGAPGDWTGIGPAPIGGVGAGRVAALAVNRTNPLVIYAGAAQGGVWKTTNGGDSWTPLTDTQCSLATGAITIDPLDSNIVYVGTGEQNYSGDSYYGCGILKSTNGGTSWTTLGASIFDTNTGGAHMGRIAIIPGTAPATSSSVILAATDFGLYRSADAGATWTKITVGSSHVVDVAVKPNNPLIVYASVLRDAIYQSNDGGLTFPTRLATGWPTSDIFRIQFTISQSAPETMYAAVGKNSNSQLLGIFRSTDGGVTWVQAAGTGASCSAQCWYDIAISVDPTNPAIVYFSGLGVYRSVNSGETFTNITSTVHVDQHAFAFDPTAPTTIYAGSDGGVYRSTTSGANWLSLNSNMAITQFYHGISFSPAGNQVLGGTQDNGTATGTPGVSSWFAVLGGDGGFTAVNPLTGVAFGETQWDANFGGPRKAGSVNGFMGPSLISGITMSESALFIPPIEMDMARPHTLYFGTRTLYRSRNNGDSWTAINLTPGRNAGNSVSAIAPAASDSLIVYVGTADGNVQVTTDGGVTWTSRITGLANRYVTDFAVHRSNPSIVYMTNSGFGTGHVWKSTNAGVTWTNLSSNLPDMPINGIAFLPDGSLYIAADIGVYKSTNDGTSWAPFGNGFPNVAAFDVVYHALSSTLAAATHGRGVFTTTVVAPATAAALALKTVPFGGAGSGQPLTRQPVVAVVGPAGDVVAGVANMVTATLASGTGTLGGTTTVAAVNGIATFTNLTITGAGIFTLNFTSPGLTTVTSASFSVTARRGDVTSDGVVTAADALQVLQQAVGLTLPPTSRATPNGDANCDGVVNSIDAAIILSFVVGRDVTRFCVNTLIP